MPYVHDLNEPHDRPAAELSALIGGKAAGLVVMTTELGLPVPPGFTITTVACNEYLGSGWPAGLDEELRTHLHTLEQAVGRRLGDAANPLLVSVRSGAPISMPGMMDTILNLGLNEETERGLAEVSGDSDFAADCHRRLRDMFSETVGAPLPDDPWQQLRMAVEAVFRSWNSDRARAYRSREHIPDDLGTAVTVQAMIFGNWGDDSASGVLFTRNPATGEPTLYGDVLFASQGEDVVAGTHETQPLAALDTRLPDAGRRLREYASVLEHHFADLCDIEFTVEHGRLWMLQVRVGKRTPQAALRMAVDMAEDPDFPLTRAEAVQRVAPLLAHPPVLSTGGRRDAPALATGLGASPGVATGVIATSSAEAVATAESGHAVILVRAETSPEDVQGMARSVGVLTASGGLASHAAVVARGWGIPAVVGARSLDVGDGAITIAGRVLRSGDVISIDGATGEVFAGEVAQSTSVAPEAATLLRWAQELGIDIGAGAPAAATAPHAAAAVTRDEVLRALLVKGSVLPDGLAAALMADTASVQPLLDELTAAGLVERAAGMHRLTIDGKLHAGELIAADRERWGEAAAAAALDAFQAFDHRMKDTVTAWQLKNTGGEQTLNDHTDADYDRGVLDQLAALHHDTARWLGSMTDQPERFGRYAARLEHALDAVRSGDERFVASPRVDSYHGVWFELHEDLIQLAGRTRREETAAGRA